MTPAPASIRSFSSIEQLEELPRELGWPLEYRQLEPGCLSSTFTQREGNFWFLMEEHSNRSVEVAGGATSGMIVLAVAEHATAIVNGDYFSCNRIALQTPDSDFRATVPAGTKLTQVGIAEELFEDVISAVAPDLIVQQQALSLIDAASDELQRVRQAIRTTLASPASRNGILDEAVSRIVAEFVASAADHDKTVRRRGLHSAAARRALDRAREYIEGHVSEAIRIESLCRYSGTTLRSLERIFARELDMTPQEYVMARRLNAARRRLLKADNGQDVRVTDVAHNYGFGHLGRFAGDYRRYFGESPRETLQSR